MVRCAIAATHPRRRGARPAGRELSPWASGPCPGDGGFRERRAFLARRRGGEKLRRGARCLSPRRCPKTCWTKPLSWCWVMGIESPMDSTRGSDVAGKGRHVRRSSGHGTNADGDVGPLLSLLTPVRADDPSRRSVTPHAGSVTLPTQRLERRDGTSHALHSVIQQDTGGAPIPGEEIRHRRVSVARVVGHRSVDTRIQPFRQRIGRERVRGFLQCRY